MSLSSGLGPCLPRALALGSIIFRQYHTSKPVYALYQRAICVYLKNDIWHAIKDGFYDPDNIVTFNTEGLKPEYTVVKLSDGKEVPAVVYKTSTKSGWMVFPKENKADSHQ